MQRVIAIAICGALVGILLIAPLIWLLPSSLMLLPYTGVSVTAPGLLPPMDVLKAQNDIRHSIVETVQLLGTLATAIGIIVTLYLTNQNVRLAQESAKQGAEASRQTLEAQRQSRLGERFSEAVGRLNSCDVAVRVGAIYILSRVAKESADDYYWPAAHLLSSFLRDRRPAEPGSEPATVAPLDDAKAVAAFFSMGLGTHGGIVDLSRTDLHGLDFTDAIFWGANFDGAKLDGAKFVRAVLNGSKFFNVNASSADFTDARLIKSSMNGMDLTGAKLTRADLRGASVTNAKFHQVFGPIRNVTQQQIDSVAGRWTELIGSRLTDRSR